MNSLLENLLKNEENLWLEFKCCWKDTDEHKVWGEFLKDFASLFNTYTETNDTKYLVIGYDEITKKCQDYHQNNGKKLSIITDISKFKSTIIEKLKNHFRNTPSYRQSSELPDIENYFEIEILEKDNVEILIFRLMPAPYLLELKKQLMGNETFRDGNIIVRKLKTDRSPEIVNAPSGDIEALKKYTDKNKREKFPEKRITIEKIVTVFKNKYSPSSQIKDIADEHNYSSGIFFEIYSISGDYTPAIDFIYFSKYTNQTQSLKTIKNDYALSQTNKKIILINERNKDNGVIDKQRIKKLFDREYSNVEIYYIEEFSALKLYHDLVDDRLFHKEHFYIHDFIQPMTDKSTEKTANFLLQEWFQDVDKPLVVLKGLGGIGKTTVVKYFIDNLHQKQNPQSKINTLFINSHDLIHDIMKNPQIEDLFDFYRLFADKYHIEKKFDKKNLELSIDDGNILIVLDGIDEVITKIGSSFNVAKFIESIFNDYSSNMGKAKIIITCRDYFWDKAIDFNDDILTLALKPFTKEMAKQYFGKHFKRENQVDIDEKKVEKAIKLAEEFSIVRDTTYTYIPYILDMIKENILTDSSMNFFDSKILLEKGSINDFIVGKVCEREIKKLDNSPIDKQLELFMDIAFEYEGVLEDVHLEKLGKKHNINLEKFRAHPLLKYSKHSARTQFRYDFFNEYFKNIGLAIFLNNENFIDLTENMTEILVQHISYDGSLMKDLEKRLSNIDFEELKLKIFTFIKEELYEKTKIEKSLLNRVNSSLFTLLLVLGKFSDRELRTELLKEIYEEENKIKKLCLINLHTLTANKILFDFKDLYFEDCYFENFENFTECSFNEKTFFSKCSFIAPLHKKGIKSQFEYKNFDQTEAGQCNLEGIIDVLEERKNDKDDVETDIRNVLKIILRLFWENSTFRQKQKDEIRKKMKNNNDIIDILVKKNILNEVPVTTRQKRNDRAYRLNEKYSNLRKIMEENDTCSEFEEIVNIVKEN